MYFGFAKVLSPQKIGSANLKSIWIANPLIVTFAEVPQIIKKICPQICGFAKLTGGPPTSGYNRSFPKYFFMDFFGNKLLTRFILIERILAIGGWLRAGWPVPAPTGPAAPSGGRGGRWCHTVSAGRPCPLYQVSRLHPVTLRQKGTSWRIRIVKEFCSRWS
jgi:hypothetical protein